MRRTAQDKAVFSSKKRRSAFHPILDAISLCRSNTIASTPPPTSSLASHSPAMKHGDNNLQDELGNPRQPTLGKAGTAAKPPGSHAMYCPIRHRVSQDSAVFKLEALNLDCGTCNKKSPGHPICPIRYSPAPCASNSKGEDFSLPISKREQSPCIA